MNFADRKMDKLVDEIAVASKDEASKQVEYKVVVEKVEQRLRKDGLPTEVRAEIYRRVAETETTRYFNRRKPKPAAQTAFYHPEMWLPLGDGKRVQLCDAGTADLLTYRRIIEKNRRRINAAADLTVDYLDSRIKALNANADKRLDWVERNVFGWVPTDDDPDFDDPPDDQ